MLDANRSNPSSLKSLDSSRLYHNYKTFLDSVKVIEDSSDKTTHAKAAKLLVGDYAPMIDCRVRPVIRNNSSIFKPERISAELVPKLSSYEACQSSKWTTSRYSQAMLERLELLD